MKFSVLMTVYHGDCLAYLKESFSSITNQTLMPNEIVLVIDGPIHDELKKYIFQLEEKNSELLKVVRLKKNIGLASALNMGIKSCSYDLIARMDTDDYSLNTRFEKQINLMINNKNIDLVGSWYKQFDSTLTNFTTDRKVPQSHSDIVNYARFRVPINHPSIIIRKSALSKIGGYPEDLGFFEDWGLTFRLIKNGNILINIQEYLIHVRGGSDFYQRRGGFQYFISEIKYLIKMRDKGYFTSIDFIFNILLRSIIRLTPIFFRKKIYLILRKVH
jgi:glycosyltransferase involved in cell wall biosynthesis